MRVINQTTKNTVIDHVSFADHFFSRLKGLMFRKALESRQALIIKPCQQIHTHFMRFSIDVAFLDHNHQILHIERSIRPWRFSRFIKKAALVLESNAGELKECQIGDYLIFVD